MRYTSLFISIFLVFHGSILFAQSNQKILFVCSNQHTYGNTSMNASNHFAEIVLAYDVFVRQGYTVDFVSPEGGAIPIGYISTSDPIQKKYLYDADFMQLLKQTKKPSEVQSDQYVAVYYSGGGAAMFGVADNTEIQSIAINIYQRDGIISSVCHGTAGIVHLKDQNGQALYANKKISAYPDLFENMDAAYYQTFPFSIEQRIQENGGIYVFSDKPRDNFYIHDGNFITGQDPSATVSVAETVVSVLQNKF